MPKILGLGICTLFLSTLGHTQSLRLEKARSTPSAPLSPPAQDAQKSRPTKEAQDLIQNKLYLKEPGFCFESAIGFRMTYAYDEKVIGANARVALEHSDHDRHYIRTEFNTIKDTDRDEDVIDFDRKSLWFEGKLEGGYFFQDRVSTEFPDLRWGLKACITGQDNSPTSTEKFLSMELGPSLIYQNKNQSLRLDLGVYSNSYELDDDVPATRGFSRDELSLESAGISCQVSGTHYFDNGINASLRAKAFGNIDGDYSEFTVGSEVEVPLALILGNHCRFWIRAHVEKRFFDLGSKSEALPFDNETYGGLEVVWRWGRRSPLYR
jgi:hypothetical protein